MCISIWFGGTGILKGQPTRYFKFNLNHGEKPTRSDKTVHSRNCIILLNNSSETWRHYLYQIREAQRLMVSARTRTLIRISGAMLNSD